MNDLQEFYTPTPQEAYALMAGFDAYDMDMEMEMDEPLPSDFDEEDEAEPFEPTAECNSECYDQEQHSVLCPHYHGIFEVDFDEEDTW